MSIHILHLEKIRVNKEADDKTDTESPMRNTSVTIFNENFVSSRLQES